VCQTQSPYLLELHQLLMLQALALHPGHALIHKLAGGNWRLLAEGPMTRPQGQEMIQLSLILKVRPYWEYIHRAFFDVLP